MVSVVRPCILLRITLKRRHSSSNCFILNPVNQNFFSVLGTVIQNHIIPQEDGLNRFLLMLTANTHLWKLCTPPLHLNKSPSENIPLITQKQAQGNHSY